MPGTVDMINFAIAVSGITISVMGLVLAFRTHYMNKQIRFFFLCVFSVLIAYTVSDLISQISLVFLGGSYSILSKAAIFLESLFSSLLMPMLTIYMLRLCDEDIHSWLFFIVSGLWIVYFLLLVFTQFTTVIYTVNKYNEYRRGPLYPVLLVPAVLLMLCNMFGLYRRRNKLNPKERKAIFIYLLIPVISMLIQMAFYSILLIVLGSSVSALFMFIFILDDQAEKTIAQSIEIGEQQLRIRSLQMRPHFIYNTMSNIYYLCELDPKKAQLVINDFTTYLRKNFSSLVKQDLIPFSDELEHTKAFLAVVKARYENHLFTKFDTQFTAFRIPPLTLEPLVENAVKHGLDPELPPLHVWVRTQLADNGVIIIVENSGAELSLQDNRPEKDESDEPHIGLSNVSDRLKALCGGTLNISRRKAGGTIVIINIPLIPR